MTDGAGSGLRSLPMGELAVEVHRAYPRGSGFDRLLSEVERRWAAAGERQETSLLSALGDHDGSVTAPTMPGLDAVEQARQFLGVQTLIHTLWILLLSLKLGIVLLVVGALHLVNLLIFSRIRRNSVLLDSMRPATQQTPSDRVP